MYQTLVPDVHKRIEFSMPVLTPFSLEDARHLLAHYDLADASEVRRVEPVLTGTVNSNYAVWFDDSRCFVRIYEEQDRDGAREEAARLEVLARRGVRTPTPTPMRDGSFVATVHGKPVVVFPWCEGEMRCLASVTPREAHRVGVALAQVHVSGEDLPARPGRFEPEDLELRLDRLARAPYPTIAAQVEPIRSKLELWVARRDPALPRGLVHGDVFRDNVLWDRRDGEAEISALLDFESASLGVLAYDLMVTVLAWSFRDALDASIAESLVRGYETVRPLTEREWIGLLAEGCVAAIRFMITRLTDLELPAAEAGVPARRDKDWRRFAMRLATLEALGEAGLRQVLRGDASRT